MTTSKTSQQLLPPAAVVVALAVGFLGVLDARIFLVAGALIGLGAVVFAAYRWPRQAVACTYALLLIAGTKFRERDPSASLTSSAIDAQVVIELALYGVVACVVAVAAAATTTVWTRLTRMETALAAFTALAVGSVLWSAAPSVTLVRGAELAIVLAASLLSMRMLGPGTVLRVLTRSLVVYVLAASAITLAFPSLTSPVELGGGITRFRWFFVHPIDCATYIAFTLTFVTAEALTSARGWRTRMLGVPIWVHAGLLVALLLPTNARGPFLGLAAAVVLLVLRTRVRSSAALISGAAAVALGVTAVVSGMGFDALLRAAAQSRNPLLAFLARGQSVQTLTDFSGRGELWVQVERLIVARPVLGYGYQGSREPLLAFLAWAGHAHNALAQTVLDLGVVGGALIWSVIANALLLRVPVWTRTSSPADADAARVFGALACMLVCSVTDVTFAGPPGVFAAVLFVCVLAKERLSPARAARAAYRAPAPFAPAPAPRWE